MGRITAATYNARHMYVVILAGGGGTRLRPISRPDRPKPFLPLLGSETLFQRTVGRIAPLVGPDDIYCVTDRRYGQLVREQAPDVQLIVEPVGKNTAAAIALATAMIPRPDDEVMLVLPADHWIEREEDFRAVIATATGQLATRAFEVDDPLVTLGVRATHASTDYGYLRPDTMRARRVEGLRTYPLLAFEEKPTEARARELVNMPGVAWNAGMFAWRRRAITAALEKYTPLMTMVGTALGSDIALATAYERLQPLSIDKAVMEGAAADRKVVMGSMDVGWSDVGSWTALLAALTGDGAGVTGRVLQTGETFEAGPDDLVVRTRDGRLVVEPVKEGRIVADGVWAHLAGARTLGAEVRAMLDRVERQESRA
jgi:mannose-1-phosphate guanylyltransferase